MSRASWEFGDGGDCLSILFSLAAIVGSVVTLAVLCVKAVV